MKGIITILIILFLLGAGYYVITHTNVGKKLLTQASQSSPTPTQTTGVSPTGSSLKHSGARAREKNIVSSLPAGATPIFGQVTEVNGNTLTVQRQGKKGNATTLTVALTSSTQYSGGSQSDITSGVRIAGYGTTNSDSLITAEKIIINPTF